MKIGVITYSDSKDNYGQILQAYALQNHLKALGHDPFLIRYDALPPVTGTGDRGPGKMLRYLSRFPHYVRLYFLRKRKRKARMAYYAMADFTARDFDGFRSRHIVSTGIYSPEELRKSPPQADAYICGSDQVWFVGNDDAYFLSFVPEGKMKVAYAPSFGGVIQLSDTVRNRLIKLIGGIDALGLRESSGVELCHNLGFDGAVKVPDPTLLLENHQLEKLIEGAPQLRENGRKYALVYLIGHTTSMPFRRVQKYVESKNLEMVYVATQGRADLPYTANPTPEQWLSLIRGAELVITNSFHCIVFSLLFHKNFVALPMGGGDSRNNDRLVDILGECGLLDRIAWKSLPVRDLSDEDFMKFEDFRSRQIACAAEFLSVLDK